jgi:hypothetical protein
MKSEPLFDRTEIERIIHSAKCNRVGYLRREIASVGPVARWARLGGVAAVCITCLVMLGHLLRTGLAHPIQP